MNKIRGIVVAALLAVWCFPAVSSAKTLAPDSKPLPALITESSAVPAAQRGSAAEAPNLAAREQQSRELQDFKGGAVAVYVSSGVLLVAVIVLLLLLV
ncbi:MAG TPA: hypothetical protein VN853_00060 [Polyangia bacterium]|jgi:hypothetical protein|nr:hypothetical protein [Polyangia bacterium]